MRNDDDPVAPVDLLIDLLAEPDNGLNANLVVADASGIHWNAVRQAARVIRTLGERSPQGQGNFSFGAIAMVQAYGPFYPGAWHPGGAARSFAIGLESASVVMDVFANHRDPRNAAHGASAAGAGQARGRQDDIRRDAVEREDPAAAGYCAPVSKRSACVADARGYPVRTPHSGRMLGRVSGSWVLQELR